MAKANPIEAFPADIDRDAFGHWLSGFTDGEGCFTLAVTRRSERHPARGTPSARFTIGLREDELPILRLIQSYLGCGLITCKGGRTGQHAQRTFRVNKVADLVSVLIPHFQTFPLRAKKRRDFLIWEQGVHYLQASQRLPKYEKRVGSQDRWKGRGRGKGRGIPVRWSDARFEHFCRLVLALKDARRFCPADAALPFSISGDAEYPVGDSAGNQLPQVGDPGRVQPC